MMSKEIFLLFFINVCSAIGYSLIAPLYPLEAKEKGIQENLCGIVISMFAVSNFFATPFTPALIGKYGRKEMFYTACILEASSTVIYGLLGYFTNYYLFLIVSVLVRFAHGIGASFSATLVYSAAASICDPSQLKTTLGMMELAWCLGLALGPICASVFYFIGGYTCPFIVCGLAIYGCIPFIYNLNLPDDEEGEVPPFMTALMNFTVLTIFFCVVMDIFCKTFYYPTFTNHLMDNYGLSIESASFFFVISMFSYFALIKYLNSITHRLGLKLTIVIGLFFLFLGVLLLPPIPIFPKSTVTIIIGLTMLGVSGAAINVPAICDLIETLKASSMRMDHNQANDMASAIYNLGLNFGEAIGPAFGGYVTEKRDFQTSCVYTSLIVLAYCIFFTMINYQIIMKQLEDGKLPLREGNEVETPEPGLRKMLTDDSEDYQSIKGKVNIDLDRSYVSRYRAYSYSNRSSKRSSFTRSADVYLHK